MWRAAEMVSEVDLLHGRHTAGGPVSLIRCSKCGPEPLSQNTS